MNNKTVAVLFGGCSSEYSVSLQSAYSVLKNIDKEKYTVLLIGITKQGDWFRYSGGIDLIPTDTWHLDSSLLTPIALSPSRSDSGLIEHKNGTATLVKIDCVLPILHGKNGEDGTVQGMFELAGIPVAGCGSLGSALCMSKHVTQRLAETVGVKVPKALVLHSGYNEDEVLSFADGIGYPLFVKPVKAGSSCGVTRVEDSGALFAAVEAAFGFDDTVMVEEAVKGKEVSCAVMGNDKLIVGEVDEVEVKSGFYDFEAKYMSRSTVIHLPARICPEERERIKKVAAELYKATGCNGFARVDLFYTDKGEIVFGEINTIPGFTEHSHFPRMMMAAGYSFAQIIDYFIENAK